MARRRFQTIDHAFYDHEQPVIDELVAAGIVAKPVKASDVFIPTLTSTYPQDRDAAQ